MELSRQIHPGEVLREEFMDPLGITPYALVTADTALRIARYFRTTPEFWMNLQGRYELESAKREIGNDLKEIEPRAA